jgi:hypothetical protein
VAEKVFEHNRNAKLTILINFDFEVVEKYRLGDRP